MKGYSSFEEWEKLSKIKSIEVDERGNQWFDDADLDLSQYLGKWVCLEPQYAVWYLFESSLHGVNPFEEECPDNVDEETWAEFCHAWENALDHVVEIDLTGTHQVLEDNDHGFLYIRLIN